MRAEQPLQEPGPAEREVRQLLGKARVHTSKRWGTPMNREHDADEASFFVRVDRIVTVRRGTAQRVNVERQVEAEPSPATDRFEPHERAADAAHGRRRRPAARHRGRMDM